MGFGSAVVGDITIADGVAIGANAVVTKSIDTPNITVGGIPDTHRRRETPTTGTRRKQPHLSPLHQLPTSRGGNFHNIRIYAASVGNSTLYHA